VAIHSLILLLDFTAECFMGFIYIYIYIYTHTHTKYIYTHTHNTYTHIYTHTHSEQPDVVFLISMAGLFLYLRRNVYNVTQDPNSQMLRKCYKSLPPAISSRRERTHVPCVNIRPLCFC
jgi:hypothetical protein